MTESFDPQNQESVNLPSSDNNSAPKSKQIWWAGAILATLVVGILFLTVMQYQTNGEIISQLEQANQGLKDVESRTAVLEANFVEMDTKSQEASDKLTETEKKLANTRWAARKLRKSHEQTKEELSTALDTHKTELESISGEVTEVKDEVATTQVTLAETQTQLGRAIGDLGQQSGLIARNHEELEVLKRRGAREYFEFDLRKSKQYARVGMVSVRLNKTDTKRNKYTMTLLTGDKRIEKKDKTLFEPVQFYTEQRGKLLEMVVFELHKNQVVGYLSAPKEEVAANRPVN
jgi:chromosome segregation ATPase